MRQPDKNFWDTRTGTALVCITIGPIALAALFGGANAVFQAWAASGFSIWFLVMLAWSVLTTVVIMGMATSGDR